MRKKNRTERKAKSYKDEEKENSSETKRWKKKRAMVKNKIKGEKRTRRREDIKLK